MRSQNPVAQYPVTQNPVSLKNPVDLKIPSDQNTVGFNVDSFYSFHTYLKFLKNKINSWIKTVF